MANESRKKLSDRVLVSCHKLFWNSERKGKKGMLSWGEITKMLSNFDLHLSNGCLNSLYRISDGHKHGCINFNEFLQVYFECEFKIIPPANGERMYDLSPRTINQIRREFFDPARKRHGKLGRVEVAEMIFNLGIILTNEELKSLLEIGDCTKDGKIPFQNAIYYFLEGSRDGDRAAAELAIINRCFVMADVNGNGRLSRQEFCKLLKSIGLPLENRQANYLFSLADDDKSGNISFEEFKAVCLKTDFSFRSPVEQAESEKMLLSSLSKDQIIQIRHYFSRFDRNRDGRLSRDELALMIRQSNMKDKAIRKAHVIARKRKDESISFREIIQLFASLEEVQDAFFI